MKSSDPRVSVIIPTVRPGALARALQSVEAQTLRPVEVVVVDDAVQRSSATAPDSGALDVRVHTTGGGLGPAGARNVGLSRVTGDLVAFLDDDDLWLPHHLASAAEALSRRPDVDLYACAAVVRTGEQERVQPAVCFDSPSRSLLRFYYGRTTWARRGRRVMTPTLVFRRAVAALRMDTSLRAREDTWWLLEAERAGHRLWQSSQVGVVVHQDPDRERARSGLADELAWARRLDSLEPGYGLHYLVGTTGRWMARCGDRAGLAALRDEVAAYGAPLPMDLRGVLLLERSLAAARRWRRTS